MSQPANANMDLREQLLSSVLLAALEPFADIDGEGAEDFPDSTPVVVKFGRTTHYALKLGDFRRAREAARLAEEHSA